MVIGGAGFIGSHLVERLIEEEPAEIIIYDNFARGTRANLENALKNPKVSIFPDGGDILHFDVLLKAMEGVDYVFHLAALWLLQCHEYPEAAFEVNFRGTFNVIRAAHASNIKKLIFSSSASVYGNANYILTEESPFSNDTFYGASKITGEEMLKAYHQRYGLPYIALRYFNAYGPRQDYKGVYIAVIMKILDRLDQGLPPILMGDGSQSYDFIYVDDIARANILAAKSSADHGVFNVCTGEKTSIREICDLLIELSGRSDISIEFRDAAQTFVTSRLGAPEKAKKELGFTAEKPLKEGLQKLIDWRNKDKTVGK